MNPRLLIAAVCISVAVVGCTPRDFMRGTLERIAPDDDETLAMQCLTDVRAREYEALKARLERSLVTDGLDSQLTGMADALDHGEPLSIELVGCNVFTSSGNRRSTLTYEFQFADAWAVASVIIDTDGASKRMVGLHVNQTSHSLEEMNAFTFSGKGVSHYLILAFAVAILLVIGFALLACIRTPGLKRKWLWIVFILFGVGSAGFNWTTGDIHFNPLSISIRLFGVSAVKGGVYAPWIISLSLPLGAVIFLFRRRKLSTNRPPAIPSTPSVPVATETPDRRNTLDLDS